MSTRPATFLLAALALVGLRIVIFVAKRKGRPFLEPAVPAFPTWRPGPLVLASFLTLFAELAFIRWIAVEVRVFAYFKNLALLLCFVGFGLGCALAAQKPRWSGALTAFLGLLVVVRMPWKGGAPLEALSQSLGGAVDSSIWILGSTWNWMHFMVAALLAGMIFLLILWVFVPLGQTVSGAMNRAPDALRAYSWNLLGSLAGVLVFFAVSRLMLAPPIWLGAVLVGISLLQSNTRDRTLVLSLLIPLGLLLHEPSSPDHYSVWTPYQQIEYSRFYQDGDFVAGNLRVNHIGYQAIVNLSPEFLHRHPALLQEAVDDNPYNLPFRFTVNSPKVIVVGAGTGNDVAAALRNGSALVDAVDIDPAIVALGKREHPEHPYDSPRVTVTTADARAFLKRSSQKYDLVLFGLLDSHTQLSDYANMRLDNFVYTRESFHEAREHLSPDGVMYVKFEVNRPWIARRVRAMLEETFGKPPLVFFARSSYSVTATCFVISREDRVEDALAADSRLDAFVRQNALAPDPRPIAIPSDDWPYLYHEGRWIPRTYYTVGALVILIAIGLYSRAAGGDRQLPSLFFFSMGAGFILLETQVISRLALFFGTVWQVNGIVISALLVALLLANAVVERRTTPVPRYWVLAALLAGLAIAYWFPFDRIRVSQETLGTIAIAVFSVPVVFAGILFSSEFRNTESRSRALAANMLGAVAGGLMENLSLLLGMRALLLVALAVYCLAGVGLWTRQRADTALQRTPA